MYFNANKHHQILIKIKDIENKKEDFPWRKYQIFKSCFTVLIGTYHVSHHLKIQPNFHDLMRLNSTGTTQKQ